MVVKISGGNSVFKSFLRKCGDITFVEFSSMKDALYDTSICDACIFLPEEDKKYIETLTCEDIHKLQDLKKGGTKIYLENYMSLSHHGVTVSYSVNSTPVPIQKQVLVCEGSLQKFFGEKAILQANNIDYLPASSSIRPSYRLGFEPLDAEILLRLGHHIGTISTEDDTSSDTPVLFRSEGLYASLLPFSRFNNIAMLPNYRYCKLFAFIFGNILSVSGEAVEKAFNDIYKKLATRLPEDYVIDASNRERQYKVAVENAVKWHLESGIIVGDIATELIASSTGWINDNRRVDSGMYSGWLLYEAGYYLDNIEWKERGKALYDYYADKAQIESGAFKGLFKWFIYDYGPSECYTIDCGRCGLSLINMYRLTGEEKYLDKIRLLADGFLNWFNEKGFLSSEAVLYYNDAQKDKFEAEHSSKTPAISGEIGLFLGMASKLFREEKYIKACAKLAQKLCEIFPDYSYYGHTTSIRHARFLMLLAAVQDSGLADHSEMINGLLDYLYNIQLPSGAFYVEDNLSYEKYGTAGFGGENGVNAPWEDEKISDQLYSMNNIMMALSALSKAKNTQNIDIKRVDIMLEKMLDYITRIQISDDDTRYNGAWMRAFDVTRWEYFGLNVEDRWGSYCVMTGWTMGILPLELLAASTNNNHYIREEVKENSRA